MNKKLYTLAVGLLSLTLLTACSTKNTETKKETINETNTETFLETNSQNEGKDEMHKFEATITEIEADKLTVSLNTAGKEGNLADTIIVNLSQDNNYDFKVGDKIEVEYNGMMTRSIPPQISATNITLLYDSKTNE